MFRGKPVINQVANCLPLPRIISYIYIHPIIRRKHRLVQYVTFNKRFVVTVLIICQIVTLLFMVVLEKKTGPMLNIWLRQEGAIIRGYYDVISRVLWGRHVVSSAARDACASRLNLLCFFPSQSSDAPPATRGSENTRGVAPLSPGSFTSLAIVPLLLFVGR